MLYDVVAVAAHFPASRTPTNHLRAVPALLDVAREVAPISIKQVVVVALLNPEPVTVTARLRTIIWVLTVATVTCPVSLHNAVLVATVPRDKVSIIAVVPALSTSVCAHFVAEVKPVVWCIRLAKEALFQKAVLIASVVVDVVPVIALIVVKVPRVAALFRAR